MLCFPTVPRVVEGNFTGVSAPTNTLQLCGPYRGDWVFQALARLVARELN